MDIKDFQLKYGFTNQKMAELFGCSLPTIQKWRSGAITISGAAERLMELLDFLAKGSPEQLNNHMAAIGGKAGGSEMPSAREPSVINDLEQSVSKAVKKFELALELRHQQDALEKSEARYRAMVETQKEAIRRWNPDTTLTFVNEAYCRFFGQTQQELIGQRWADSVSGENRPTLYSYIQRMVSTKTHRHYEQRLAQPNGKEIVLEWTDTPLVRPDGAVVEIQSVGRDITARVHAEERLRTKLEMERMIVRLSSHLLGGDKVAAERMIEECLESLGKFSGADRSYLFRISDDRKTISNTLEWCREGTPSVKASFQNLDCSLFSWGMELLQKSDPIILHDVGKIPADALAEQEAMMLAEGKSLLMLPVYAAGTSYGFVGFVTIHERTAWTVDEVAFLRMTAEILALYYSHEEKVAQVKMQREQIQNDATFVRTLLDSIPFPIFSKDRDLVYRVCNKAFAEAMGYEIDEMAGKTVFDIAPAELACKYDDMDRALLERGGMQRYEGQVLFADGSWHDMFFTKSVYNDANDEVGGMVGIMQDFTEWNRAQVQLQQAKERAESAAATKTRLLSNVSHELRAPLHVVLAMAELLQRKAGSVGEDERQEVLSLITDSAHQLWVMIDDLLALSHIERGSLRLGRAPFNLHDMGEQLCSYYKRQAEEKGLEFSCSCTDDFPHVVNSSEHRIRQVLTQMISNALKFTEQGSIVVHWSFESAEGCRGTIRIDVHDTGIGIDEESYKEISRAFEHLDAFSLKRHSGLGIGLAVARRLARSLGGDLCFTSEKGVGTHFTFTLPVDVCDSSLAEVSPDGVEELGATVMVVDDDSLNRQVMCRMLERMGMNTVSADGGHQALDLLGREACDLVMIDIHMPNMDGFELLAGIRELEKVNGRPEIPVVAVTAYALPSDRSRFIQAGMKELLPKPFTFDELNRLILTVLDGGSASI